MVEHKVKSHTCYRNTKKATLRPRVARIREGGFYTMCGMEKLVAGSLKLIPTFSFSSFKHELFLMYPLAALLSRLWPRFACILGHYGHARSPTPSYGPPWRGFYVETKKPKSRTSRSLPLLCIILMHAFMTCIHEFPLAFIIASFHS